MKKAISLYRVSTHRQVIEGNSLDAQEKRVVKAATFLETVIEKTWRVDASSKVGKNLARKDLREALTYCSTHKVDYFIIDEVDRFMRSIDEYYWHKVEFKKRGVKLIFASQPELSDNDQLAKLREMLAIYEAEASNAERSRKTTDKMRARVAAGYFPFRTRQGYRKTTEADGLHVPDEPRFSLLQHALQAIADFEMTPKEAHVWLCNQGYTTPGGRRLDMSKFHTILLDPYYAGVLKVNDWPINENGLHQAMITKDQHETNVEIITGRKIRPKKRHNPEFPLNRSFHLPCEHENAKLTGANHKNGKGWSRKVYICRHCKKRVSQQAVHESFQRILEQINYSNKGLEALKQALHEVWKHEEANHIDRKALLTQQLASMKESKSELIRTLSNHPNLADDITEEISTVKTDIARLEEQISATSDIDTEFKEFVDFALDYIENLRRNWWTLPGEKQAECKQLLFNDVISIDQDGKVYTPQISTIYTLQNAKSDPKVAQNANMVELPGIAPGSAR